MPRRFALPFPHAGVATWIRRIVIGLAAAVMFAGCASQIAYHQGKNLIEKGKVEEGLAKFRQALDGDPYNVEYKQAYLQTLDRTTYRFAQQAERAVADGKIEEAQKLYSRILAIDPQNDRAKAGLQEIERNQRHASLLKEAEAAFKKKDLDGSSLKLSSVLAENPHNPAATRLKRSIDEKTAIPPAESTLAAAYRKPITIEFKDVALKQIFEVISRTSGLNFLFDRDVKTDQRTSIFLKNSTIESAVNFTLLTNQLEQRLLDANTILIYPNTPAKQKDYQEMMVKTFFLANAEAKTVANTLKTIVKSRDIVTDDKLNAIIVRDSPEAIRMAERLVAIHDVPEPEVMLEVEVLEVSRTRLMELGIKWPDSLVLTPLVSSSGGSLTVDDLRGLNRSGIGVSVSPVTINAKAQDSDANILANPRIRARNHEKAKILIGERVPNITTTATSTGFVSESINYVDVGLKLEVEPTIYLDDDVAIKIALEVSNIVSQLQTKSGSVAYQIGTRNASTVLSLKDGENQVLAGLINDEDRKSGSKIPLLGNVPLVGRLFGSTANNNLKTEIVLSITPHLIRNIRRPDASLSEFHSGTETTLRVRSESSGMAPMSDPDSFVSSAPASASSPDNSPSEAPSPNGSPSGMGNGASNAGNMGANPMDTPAGGTLNNPTIPVGSASFSWQGPSQAKVGDTVVLQLVMQSDQPVTGVPATISFDNKALQVTGITEGEFLKQGGAQTSFVSRVDPNGQITFTDTRAGSGGAMMAGAVLSISFRTLSPTDNTEVQIVKAVPTGLAGTTVGIAPSTPYSLQVSP